MSAWLPPRTPLTVGIAILAPALLMTTLYGWRTQGRPVASLLSTVAGQAMPSPMNAAPFSSNSPFRAAVAPSVDPSLMNRGQQVTGKALDVADQAIQATGTAVDAGSQVIDFSANLIQQALPPKTTGTPASPMPATP